MVKYLISKGININCSRSNSAFDIAIKIQNNEIISVLLQNKPCLKEEVNPDGENPLITLVKMTNIHTEEENLSYLNQFIQRGLMVDQRDKIGKSSIFYAIDKNLILTLRVLMDHSISYNNDSNRDDQVESPKKTLTVHHFNNLSLIDYIIRFGNEPIIKFFFEYYPKLFTMDSIREIIEMKRLDLLKLVINKSNISRRDSEGNTIFNYALKDQNEKIVKYLVQNEIEISDKDITKDIIIMLIDNNQVEILKILVPKYVDINMRLKVDYYSYSLLCYSVKNGNYQLCEYLIDTNADINEKDNEDGTLPIFEAVECCNEKILKLLIDHGADINCSRIGRTPLLRATGDHCNMNIIKLLVEHGANFYDMDQGQFPLNKVIFSKDEEAFKYLIEKGVDINRENGWGISPLHYIIDFNMESFLKILVDSGVDLNMECSHRGVPLIFAIRKKRTKIAKYLIDNGADINCKDSKGQTPISMAILQKNKFIIKYLIAKGVKSELLGPELNKLLEGEEEENDSIEFDNTNNDENKSDDSDFYNNNNNNDNDNDDVNNNDSKEMIINLCILIENKNNEKVKEIIENGQIKDINQINDKGDTPLIIAVKSKNTEIIKYLIEHGASINKEGIYHSHYNYFNVNKSPLMFAVSNNDLTTVKYLVKHGAKVNIESKNEEDETVDTPLTIAVSNNNISMIKYLVEEAGADVNQSTPPPVKLAIYSSNLKITKYLVEKGANLYFHDSCYYCENPLIDSIDDIKMAKYLIDHGIDVNELQSHQYYESALMEAINHRKISVAKYLIEHGANLNSGSFLSETALSRAVFSNNFLFLKYLIENGAYVNEFYYDGIEGTNGDTPINEAITAGNIDFIKYLIEHGADIFYMPKICYNYYESLNPPEKTNEKINFNEFRYPIYLEIKKELDKVKDKLYNM